jgi:hypothetical protein
MEVGQPKELQAGPVGFARTAQENTMAEDPNDWTAPSSKDEAEILFLVTNTDLSPLQARELIREHGTDREALLAIARTMKAEG